MAKQRKVGSSSHQQRLEVEESDLMVEPAGQATTDSLPCPDCGSTKGRNYSLFRDWFADPKLDMPRLLAWVRTRPCSDCAGKRLDQMMKQARGGRPRKS